MNRSRLGPRILRAAQERSPVVLWANVAEGRDMQSVFCAAKPRTNIGAKREARAT